ncbi:MAG TPA: serine hydrolase, partial [bacterium]|nr:serine hydrolase [bacterium]
SKTMFQIGSNTKLFTVIAAGLLVNEGQLTWDQPVRESVPSIQFYNDALNSSVTLRDMLSHRTGITRHDMIWYQSTDSRAQLFEKLKYMEPQEPLRTTFLYNNMMYSAAGRIIEMKSGKTWEEFVQERIFGPLGMDHSMFTIEEMMQQPEYAVGYTEKRDSFELYNTPFWEDTEGVAPAGAITSNLEDLSHWVIALLNNGQFKGRQVIPAEVVKATLEPSIAMPNSMGEARGFWENLNAAYGMGRWTSSYRGHLLAFHGGDLPGFHSQISMMPQDNIGVMVFVIGDHCASLYNTISYNVYEKLLGMSETPWSDRMREARLKGKEAGQQARAKAGEDRVKGTKPTHKLKEYVGQYEHPAYGLLTIGMEKDHLTFDFHKIRLPLSHFHYNRFDTPDDEHDGKWSVNFAVNPQGDIDKALMSLDESEVVFTRQAAALDPTVVAQLAGSYETPGGAKFQVVAKQGGGLALVFPGAPEDELIPYKGLQFRTKEFSDVVFEFIMENGRVKSSKQRDASGEYTFKRI